MGGATQRQYQNGPGEKLLCEAAALMYYPRDSGWRQRPPSFYVSWRVLVLYAGMTAVEFAWRRGQWWHGHHCALPLDVLDAAIRGIKLYGVLVGVDHVGAIGAPARQLL